MKRVCFLFNHDERHQVAHSLPIALAMARSGAAQVTLAVANERIEGAIRSTAGDDLAGCELVRLEPRKIVSRLLIAAMDRWAPMRKVAILRDNVGYFQTFDAIVVTEKTSLILKTRFALAVPLIHTRHGAGDRAIGFNRSSGLFDLVLVSGPKVMRRLIADAGADPARLRVVGYPKFDICRDNRARFSFADLARPVALYNPHPSPRLSSWFAGGQRLIDQVGTGGGVNLMVAPHIMLFRRPWTVTIEPPAMVWNRRPKIPSGAEGSVEVDLGSPLSNDMSYTNTADLYIGDVSSQVYEFLLHPRPCLFIDAHKVSWQGNPDYAHWQAGPVVSAEADMRDAIARSLDSLEAFRGVQEALFADTFSVTEVPAAERGALAIAEYLDQRR